MLLYAACCVKVSQVLNQSRIKIKFSAKQQQNSPCLVWMNASYHLPPTHTHIIIPFAPPWVLTCSRQPQLLLPGDAEPQTVQRVVIRAVASHGWAEMSAVISGGKRLAASRAFLRGPHRPQGTLRTRGKPVGHYLWLLGETHSKCWFVASKWMKNKHVLQTV